MTTAIGKKTDSAQQLPTATVVKKADRDVPGAPSPARVQRVRERLIGSPFARRSA